MTLVQRPGAGEPRPSGFASELNPSPPTDHGGVVSLWYSFDLVKKRVEEGGWTHQVTQRELLYSRDIAGVNMRLTVGSYRELHWHTGDEWAYVLSRNARIFGSVPRASAFDSGSRPGWHGVPPGLQSGHFPEDGTLLLSK